jgi:hypothetical protein
MEERLGDGDERVRGFCSVKEKGGSDDFSLVLVGCSKLAEGGNGSDFED